MLSKRPFQSSALAFFSACSFFLQAQEELAHCEVLSTSFFGEASVQVHCGEGPEGVGWISSSTPVRKVIMKIRDRKTGRERMTSLKTRAGEEGGWYESVGENRKTKEINNSVVRRLRSYNKGGSLPISLYIPGGCGSNKIFHAVTFDFFKDPNDVEFFKEDEECSWLNENDTNWREGVKGIGKNEDIVFVRYVLPPSTKVYYDKSGEKLKGDISTFNVQTEYDELHCEELGDTFVLRDYKGNVCSNVQMCFGNEAWCSAPNKREHFQFFNYGCKALEDGTCPPPTDCIFGENSFYANKYYAEYMESFGKSKFYDFENAGSSSSRSKPRSKGVR